MVVEPVRKTSLLPAAPQWRRRQLKSHSAFLSRDGRLRGLRFTRWSPISWKGCVRSPKEAPVPPHYSPARKLDMIVSLVSDADDDAHLVPPLADRVLEPNIGSDLE